MNDNDSGTLIQMMHDLVREVAYIGGQLRRIALATELLTNHPQIPRTPLSPCSNCSSILTGFDSKTHKNFCAACKVEKP